MVIVSGPPGRPASGLFAHRRQQEARGSMIGGIAGRRMLDFAALHRGRRRSHRLKISGPDRMLKSDVRYRFIDAASLSWAAGCRFSRRTRTSGASSGSCADVHGDARGGLGPWAGSRRIRDRTPTGCASRTGTCTPGSSRASRTRHAGTRRSRSPRRPRRSRRRVQDQPPPSRGRALRARPRLRAGRTLVSCAADVVGIASSGEELVATMLSTVITRGPRAVP